MNETQNMINTKYTNYKVLDSKLRAFQGSTDTFLNGGLEHIIDPISFEFDNFEVLAICGSSFKSYNKENAWDIDLSKEVSCKKCQKKAQA